MEGTITTSIRFGPRHVTFSVADTGVGIPKEDIDKGTNFVFTLVIIFTIPTVFDRFHRVYVSDDFQKLFEQELDLLANRQHHEATKELGLVLP